MASPSGVAAIVTGHYDDVQHADHRYDPWWTPMQDPERDRSPEEMTHRVG